MTSAIDDLGAGYCVNHQRQETRLRCGKCGNFICTRCMVQTPVGVRCSPCAQMKRLPQFEVGPLLLGRSAIGGLAVSLVCWALVSVVPYLRFFLGILVGVAVGEVMIRLANRRSNRALEIFAVFDIIIGFLIVESVRLGLDIGALPGGTNSFSSYLLVLSLPAAIASFVAVRKLR